MDYRMFCKLDHGGYSVHFRNWKKYSVKEIKRIFSRFGKVLDVNVTEQDDGYRFVKFETIDEIKNCLKGLEDGKEIKILPEKKNNLIKGMDKNSSQKRIEYSTDEESNGNFGHDKTFSEIKFKKERSTYNPTISNYNETDADSSLHTNFRKINHNYKSNVNGVEAYNEQNVLVFKEKHSLPQKENFNGSFSIAAYDEQNVSVSKEKHLLLQKENFNGSSLSEKINYDSFYKILENGNYSVHCINKNKLSEEEITEIFAEYGTVLSVKPSRDLRYITYGNLDHVISCLKGLQNNDRIKMLPQKNFDLKNSNQLLENPSRKMLNEKQDSIYTFNKAFLETVGKQTRNISTSDWDEGSNNFFDTNFRNSRSNYKSNTMECEKSGSIIKTDNNKLHTSTKTDGNTHINKNISDDNRQSDLNFAEMQKKLNEISNFSPPLLDAKDSSPKNVIRLQEVIVGNVHEDYGIHYILHLLEKYDPVSVTVMKLISKNNIRYCNVFFKTINDAAAVEKEFDNYVLSGKKLIVLRKSKLIEEAMYE